MHPRIYGRKAIDDLGTIGSRAFVHVRGRGGGDVAVLMAHDGRRLREGPS
ncbi:hypothetical protein SCWH03_55620 [Streptomyces pacificus]|uniref:Uncharacterized protein n=1 Tax=Streptomyces pacificus TaxID=2705029 RepID=A0A6A0B6G2_9ACTN|nr:hypothetical protein SCWH03_55620 [Streptomyces pacificus]